MKQERKETVRKCVGCQAIRNKRDLIRVVKTSDGSIRLDFSGKLNGRGAYICRNTECLQKAVKNHGLERSLKTKVPQDILIQLEKEIDDEQSGN